MSEIEDFIEEYNNLVIGDEETTMFQIVHSGTEEAWRSFKAPVEAEKVNAAISQVANELATGAHVLRLQAMGRGGTIRGQVACRVEGRSAAARQSGNEQVQHAKALRMNIETADMQLANMAQRLQQADQAAADAEQRSRDMITDVYKMGDLVNRMLTEKENAILDREEREQRMKNMAAIVQTLTPILGQGVMLLSKFLEFKVAGWEEKWKHPPTSANSEVKSEKTN